MAVQTTRRIVLRRIGFAAAAALLIFVAVIAAVSWREQRPDFGWSPAIASPAFSSTHPVVSIDKAHFNAATAGLTQRYGPFAKLLRVDGYDVREGLERFASGTLDGVVGGLRGAVKG